MSLDKVLVDVGRQAPPHLKGHPFLMAAVTEVMKRGKKRPNMVREVIELAGEWYERYMPSREDLSSDFPPTPYDFLSGELLVEKLAPAVERVRERIFGHACAPFGDIQAAAEWIERTEAADIEDWRSSNGGRGKAVEEIERLCRENGIEVVFKATHLPYQKPGEDHVKRARAVPGSDLYALAKETERMAKHTGLAQDALVVHVLTGLRPVLSRVRFNSHYSVYDTGEEQIHRKWVQASFFARDLSYNELRSVYNVIRSSAGSKGAKPLTLNDLRLWRLVKEMGGPPQKNKRAFWRKVQQRWNQEHYSEADARYKSWEGVAKRYHRILERVG